jgi:hypothetical protein
MDVLVTVLALLAVIAAGVFLIHRLNAQHGDRIAAFHYGRDGVVAPGRKPTGRKPTRRTAATTNGAGERRDHRDGGRGRLRPRRRTHG